MKKVLLILTILFILSGCQNEKKFVPIKSDPDIQGYVMDKRDGEILVVSSKPGENGDKEHVLKAIWTSEAPEIIQIGEQVRVWYRGGIQESYPSQGTVKQIKLMNTAKPKGSFFSEKDMIQKGLEQIDATRGIVAVKSIAYVEEKDAWELTLIVEQEGEQNVQSLTIKDEI
ncbi:DUF3221 domain-containing protein [Pontibacillus yanchengensis]|uniref:DUF3221 domain-containing protein n=1 Tax=Pontibacillus yanchengensis Y32 TaxID=1385514 RepID=A0A0A2TGQ3_9BACI|nr:DUF3221 domain-containing protein [Pontibacillus yanchengensis]KGP73603.1 hypothetical protein N782_03755 [Pontibacillus yanchengensis Y32]